MITKQYRAAGGVVVDDSTGDVLLLRHGGRDGPDGRTEMRLPKGHVEPGESDVETALREVAEEAGLVEVDVAADLGEQRVEFTHQDAHVRRDERYFLLRLHAAAERRKAEEQFERVWLSWEEALEEVTFEAERKWLRRAWEAWEQTR